MDYLLYREQCFLPVSKPIAGLIAKQILELRGRGFGTKDGLPSSEWWKAFRQRHPDIAIRKPSRLKTSQINAAMNVENILDWLHRYAPMLIDSGVAEHPERIISLDEYSLVLQADGPIIGRKGSERARGREGEFHEHITFLPIVNAAGESLPPFFVFKGVDAHPDLLGKHFAGSSIATSRKRLFLSLWSPLKLVLPLCSHRLCARRRVHVATTAPGSRASTNGSKTGRAARGSLQCALDP